MLWSGRSGPGEDAPNPAFLGFSPTVARKGPTQLEMPRVSGVIIFRREQHDPRDAQPCVLGWPVSLLEATVGQREDPRIRPKKSLIFCW